MARILLAKARQFRVEQMSLTPPLGIMYIAAVLREAGHEVRIHDPRRNRMHRMAADFQGLLREFRPDVVGLSAITMEASTLYAMAALSREVLPGTPIVAGGAHPSAYPARCLERAPIDFVVVGEGENAMRDLVEAIARGGREAGAVPGVIGRGADGRCIRAPGEAAAPNLDELPLPAWGLVDTGYYAGEKSMAAVGRRPYMAIVTSRGCPYGCIYCHRVHGKRFRARSPDHVLHEMRELHDRYGIRDFEIVDDTFNLDRDRALAILGGAATLGFKPALHFPNGLRADLLDEEQIRALRGAGTQYMCVAVESAVPRLQELIRKQLDLDRVRANIGCAVRHGLYVSGFFMLGFPTETLAEARATVRFAVESPLHQAYFFSVTPYAGTPLHDLCADVAGAPAMAEAAEGADYFNARLNVSAMSDDELRGVLREAYRRFYVSPRRIARIVAAHPRRRSLLELGALALLKALPRARGGLRDSSPVAAPVRA